MPSYPQTSSEGAELVSGQEGFGIRGGDEVKTSIEQGTAELPCYKGQSSRKRACSYLACVSALGIKLPVRPTSSVLSLP